MTSYDFMIEEDEEQAQSAEPVAPTNRYDFMLEDETPEAKEAPESVWERFKTRAVEIATPDAISKIRDAYSATKKGGLKGLALQQSQGIPVLEQTMEAALTDETIEGVAKKTVARLFKANDWEELEKRDLTENAAGLFGSVREGAEKQITKSLAGGLPEDVGEGAIAVAKAPVALGARLASEAVVAPVALAATIADVQEGSQVHNMGVAAFEKVTGRRWMMKNELARLRTSDPRAWAKTRNAQSTATLAVVRELKEIGQGIGGIGTGLVKEVADLVPEGKDFASTKAFWERNSKKLEEVFGDIPLNIDTMSKMAEGMVGETMDTFDNPTQRAMENPLGMGLDLLGGVTTLGKTATRFKAAKDIAKGTNAVLSGEVIAEGWAKAVAKATPVPFVKSRANLAVRSWENAMWKDVMGSVSKNKWAREWTENAPDETREAVSRVTRARRQKAGAQEQGLDLVNEMRESVSENVGNIKYDSKIREWLPRKPKGREKDFIAAIEDSGKDFQAKIAILELHEQIMKKGDELRMSTNQPSKPVSVGKGSPTIAGQAEHAAGVKAWADYNEFIRAADDPRVVMNLRNNQALDELLDTGFIGTQRAIDDLVLEKNRLMKDKGDVAKINKIDLKIAKKKEYMEHLGMANEEMYSAAGLKKHGAWLEIDGDQLHGVDGAIKVMKMREKNIDPWEAITVKGTDPVMVKSMTAAKDVARLSTEFNQRKVLHGVMTQFEADVRTGLLYNKMIDPIRAAEMNPGAMAMNPHIALTESSNINQHLSLVEDLRNMDDFVIPHQRVIDDYVDVKLSDRSVKNIVTQPKNEGPGSLTVGGEVFEAMRHRTTGEVIVKFPEKISMSHGLDAPKYGGPELGLSGQWVRLDGARLVQSVLGERVSGWQKFISVIPKNLVINNPWSHKNAIVSDLVNFAEAGVNPTTALPRAMKLLRKKGSEADQLMSAEFRHRGGLEGATIESVDKAAGNDIGSISDIKAAFTGLPKAAKDGDLIKWFFSSYGPDGHTTKTHGAGMALHRGLMDNVSGGLGTGEKLWLGRDRLARMALVDEGFHRVALDKYGLTRKQLQDPSILKKFMREHPDAVDKGIELAAEVMFDYGSMPRGPRFGKQGKGAYEHLRDTGVMPFVAYPVKATNLWTKRLVTKPLKYKAITEHGRLSWEELEERVREDRIGIAREAGWESFSKQNDQSMNVKAFVPTAFLPVDGLETLEKLVTFEDGPGVTMWFKTLAEATMNKRWGGGKVHEEGTTRSELTAKLAYVTSQWFNPIWKKATGAGTQRGLLDKTSGELIDRDTDKVFDREEALKGFFIGLKENQRSGAARQLDRAMRTKEFAQQGLYDDESFSGEAIPGKVGRTLTKGEADDIIEASNLEYYKAVYQIAGRFETK